MRRNLLLEDAWKAISGCKVGSSEIGALQISLVTVSLGCDLHDNVGPQDATESDVVMGAEDEYNSLSLAGLECIFRNREGLTVRGC